MAAFEFGGVQPERRNGLPRPTAAPLPRSATPTFLRMAAGEESAASAESRPWLCISVTCSASVRARSASRSRCSSPCSSCGWTDGESAPSVSVGEAEGCWQRPAAASAGGIHRTAGGKHCIPTGGPSLTRSLATRACASASAARRASLATPSSSIRARMPATAARRSASPRRAASASAMRRCCSATNCCAAAATPSTCSRVAATAARSACRASRLRRRRPPRLSSICGPPWARAGQLCCRAKQGKRWFGSSSKEAPPAARHPAPLPPPGWPTPAARQHPARAHLAADVLEAVDRLLAAHLLEQARLLAQLLHALLVGGRRALEGAGVDLAHQLLSVGGAAARESDGGWAGSAGLLVRAASWACRAVQGHGAAA